MFLAPVEPYIEIGSIQLDLASQFVRRTIKFLEKPPYLTLISDDAHPKIRVIRVICVIRDSDNFFLDIQQILCYYFKHIFHFFKALREVPPLVNCLLL